MNKRTYLILSVGLGLLGTFSPSYSGEVFMQSSPTQYSSDLREWTQKVQQEPSAVNYSQRAEALRRVGLRKEAVDDINASLNMEPTNVATMVLKGQVYFEDGLFPEAVSSLNSAIKTDPNFAGGYELRALTYLRMKEYGKALDDANVVIKAEPSSAMGYLIRGTAYNGLRKYDSAIEDLTKSIGINPKLDKAYYWRGEAYQNLQEYQKSVDDYLAAIKITPDFRPAQIGLALSYYKLGKDAEALDVLNDAIEFHDADDLLAVNRYEGKKATDTADLPDPEYNLGQQIEEDLKQAMAIFDNILKDKPGDRDALRERGIANMHLGKYKEAQKDFDAANKGLPTNPTEFSGLGSEDAYKAAVPLYKSGNEALANRDYAGALKAYQDAIKQYPQFGRAWHNMAIACSGLGDNFSAELCCVHAISYRPDDWKLWRTLGNVMHSEYKADKGDPKKLWASAAAFNEALLFNPDTEADKNELRHLLAQVKSGERALTPQINFQITTMPIN